MYIKKQIEHQTVFGIPDNVQIPAETVAAIEKQFGTALKFDDGKLPLHLLSTEAMNQTAAVLQFGADKYAAHNWRQRPRVWTIALSSRSLLYYVLAGI